MRRVSRFRGTNKSIEICWKILNILWNVVKKITRSSSQPYKEFMSSLEILTMERIMFPVKSHIDSRYRTIEIVFLLHKSKICHKIC